MSTEQHNPVLENPRHDLLLERRKVETSRFSRALAGLAEAVTGGRDKAIIEESDSLAAAISRIALAYGRTPRKAVPPPEEQPFNQRTVELVEQQQLRSRKVMLRDGWHRQANYCLVIPFTGGYASLVPKDENHFEYHATTGETGIVDDSLAQQLMGEAQLIYPSWDSEAEPLAAFIRLALWRHKKTFYLIPLLLAAGALLGLLPPIITKYLVGTVIPFNDTSQLPAIAIAMVVAAVGITLFKLVASLSIVRLETTFESRGQAAVWSHLLRLPASFFRRMSTGELSVKVQSVDAIRSMLSSVLVNSAASIAMGAASLFLMFHYQHKLAFLVLLLLVLYAFLNVLIGRRVVALTRQSIEQESSLRASSFQLLSGITKLRAAAAERAAFAQWAPLYQAFSLVTRDNHTWRSFGIVLQSVMPALLLLIIIFAIGRESHFLFAALKVPENWQELDATPLREKMPPALFMAFFLAATQLLTAMKALSDAYLQLIGIQPHIQALQQIVSEPGEREDDGMAPGNLQGAIDICDVDFRYSPDGPLVLKGASLRARPGEFIAIVGPSGAGKSSLIRVILGFDEIERGAIFLDDKDLGDLNKRLVRRQFGVVLQDSQLLPGSLFDNISGGTGISMAQAWDAARLAGLEDDIKDMPMQMHTVLSEGASTLSGGQRQRVIIARALARKPAYILFDEATSALDNRTQTIVSESLENLGCTRIVIAHRLSTIANADTIYVMDSGKVVEQGNYEELMDRKGLFFQLATRQLA